MGLFDSYFDPEQFPDSGGLLGRLLSLQSMQGQYLPGDGSDLQASATGQTASMPRTSPSVSPQAVAPALGATQAGPQTPDYGQAQNIAIGDYRMPQFGSADASQASAQPPGLGDRLSAGFQNGVHTPVGNRFAALANGIAGLSSGERIDPSGSPQQDLNSQYQALRPTLGDHNAMLAIVHPEVGKALIAQALAGRTKLGNTGDADPSVDGHAGLGNEAIASRQPPGLSKVGYFEYPTNANQAFGELSEIRDRERRDTVSSDDHLSGVREGNVRRNQDGSLDVTNGTVVTLSLKDGHAKTVTVTNADVAHIDGKTGEVVIQKSPSRNGI